ncbi:hypothetical protein [Hymenobacter jeollabukensis]|uniref:Uncharacterized protein n=1 Tax=Hymenobacter jeollabukensis TaxID=2025313 RepID=A0A5R8WS59_9BACT|nr:hypothetical protein [Hymenobacter jeollabukensis]TLM93211.1 hypothetical protein FDY95_11345 [Hymenobacter jeollabukensis]
MGRYTILKICSIILGACSPSGERAGGLNIVEKQGYLVTHSLRAETMYFIESSSPLTAPLTLHNIEVENAFAFSTNERLFSDLLRISVLPDTFTLSLKDKGLSKFGWGKLMVVPIKIIYELDSTNCNYASPSSAKRRFYIAGKQDSLVFDYDNPCVDVLKLHQ